MPRNHMETTPGSTHPMASTHPPHVANLRLAVFALQRFPFSSLSGRRPRPWFNTFSDGPDLKRRRSPLTGLSCFLPLSVLLTLSPTEPSLSFAQHRWNMWGGATWIGFKTTFFEKNRSSFGRPPTKTMDMYCRGFLFDLDKTTFCRIHFWPAAFGGWCFIAIEAGENPVIRGNTPLGSTTLDPLSGEYIYIYIIYPYALPLGSLMSVE